MIDLIKMSLANSKSMCLGLIILNKYSFSFFYDMSWLGLEVNYWPRGEWLRASPGAVGELIMSIGFGVCIGNMFDSLRCNYFKNY